MSQPHGQEEHDHNHPHHGGHDHEHQHEHGRFGWLRELLPWGQGHSHGEQNVDSALETSERGIWALKVSLVGLGATALFQAVIVLISGSVALLADTVHNFSDALTAVPLWIAFALARRPPSRRYTYGYGRAEDIAGVIIVGMIALSAAFAAYESVRRFIEPTPVRNIGWVIAASVIGFLGNEVVALFRMRIGREIGSAALVADGQHARVDGLTSLAVLAGALGVLAGFPLADPLVGILITIAILFIVKDTALTMWRRLMDAVEPSTVDRLQQTGATVSGAQDVHDVRVRWLGHRLQAELHVVVDEDLSVREGHGIAEEVRHALFHAEPRLSEATLHLDPCGHGGEDAHHRTSHHADAAPGR